MPTQTIDLIKRVFRECSTSSGGEYDPARVVGYGFTTIGCFVFLALVIYDTIQKKSFDALNFATGLAGVSSTLAAAAAGVRIKDSTETKPTDTSAGTPAEPATTTTAQ